MKPVSTERIIIRECSEGDRERAEAIAEAAFQTVRHIYRPTAEAIAKKRSRPPSPRLIAIVSQGEGEDAIVGSVEYESRADEISLMALGVEPGWRRRGIARRMIEELLEVGRRSGRSRLRLWTIVQTGNVEIFRRMGFRVVRVEKAELFESDRFEVLEEALMEHHIGEGISRH